MAPIFTKKARWLWFVAALTSTTVLFLAFALWIRPYFAERKRSPLGTLWQFRRAAYDGDKSRWSSLLHTWNAEEEQVKTIMSSNVVLQAQVRRGLIKRFGSTAYGASAFPRYLDEIPEEQISAALEQVSAEQATVQLVSGPTLKFVLVDGVWKYDFFRNTSATTPHLRSVMQRNHAALHEVIRGIAQNSYASVEDALSHFRAVRLPQQANPPE